MLNICNKQKKVVYGFSIYLTLHFETMLQQLKPTNWLNKIASSKMFIDCEPKIFPIL